MTYRGHIRNGVVVFEGPAPFADGTPVRVEPEPQPAPAETLRGTKGTELLRFAGSIDPEDLREMSKAIEDCGRVDPNDW